MPTGAVSTSGSIEGSKTEVPGQSDAGLARFHRFSDSVVPRFFVFLEWLIVTSIVSYAAREHGSPLLIVISGAAYLALLMVTISSAVRLTAFLVVTKPVIWLIRLSRFLPQFMRSIVPVAFTVVTVIVFFLAVNWAVFLIWQAVDGLSIGP